MTFLQNRAINKVFDLIDDAKKKYSEAAKVDSINDPTRLRLEAEMSINEAKDWLQAIIDDSEEDDE